MTNCSGGMQATESEGKTRDKGSKEASNLVTQPRGRGELARSVVCWPWGRERKSHYLLAAGRLQCHEDGTDQKQGERDSRETSHDVARGSWPSHVGSMPSSSGTTPPQPKTQTRASRNSRSSKELLEKGEMRNSGSFSRLDTLSTRGGGWRAVLLKVPSEPRRLSLENFGVT